MSGKDQHKNGGKGPSVGSAIIVFILKIAGGLLDLFHVKGKKSFSNMTEDEQKYFSTMLDSMKEDMTKKEQ